MKYELDSKKWIENEIMKLSPADYDHTYFIVAVLTNTVTNKSIDIIVPVDVYTHWKDNEVGIGFEIISIAAIAGLCPWDMVYTNVYAVGEYTSVDGNLMKLVEETPSSPPQATKQSDTVARNARACKSVPQTETIAADCEGTMEVNMGYSLSSSIDDIKQRLDRVEKMVINPKIDIKLNPRV